MELNLIGTNGLVGAKVAVSDLLFGREFNESLIHQVIVSYQANSRSGNRKQKNREEVHHSTKKPFKQKGTGRARAGMTSSPLWRSGGRAFPNSPNENFAQKINRKMYRAGIAAILSQLVREGRLVVVEDFIVGAPKTRLVSQKIKEMGMDKVLIISDVVDSNLLLASRNLPNVLVLEPHQADPVSLVRFPNVILTKSAVAKMEEILA
ncbi:MAG: 50S ribosomal protein L4 [Betaproteobacteria bacterium HGW-Betaproteobacteria-11]|nr:MAG: 50S ribosomal protein L4 [Betaproteobacteria bacterium HGW-Betaproteobacteria-11]